MPARATKTLFALILVSLALVNAPVVDGRPCDEQPSSSLSVYTPTTTWSQTPTYTGTYTHSHHHHSGSGNGGTVTRTVTQTQTRTTTDTETDTVTQTRTTTSYAHLSSSYYPSSSSWTSVSAASVTPSPTASSGNGQCNTGPIQCCDSVQSASSPGSDSLLSSLGIVLDDLSVPVGLTCSPLSALGLGSGGNCAGTTVCCNDNSYNGLINIGCVPIVIQL